MTTDQEKADAWKATVETLQRFYSVVIAIALTSALSKLIGFLEQPQAISDLVSVSALAVAFVSTVVPFYHGMERHLYDTHRVVPKLGRGGRPFPLLADIFVFVIEGSILFAMGRNLDDTAMFLLLWSSLLIVDVIWSGLVWLVQRGERPFWAMNNLAWLLLAWAAWVGLPPILDSLGFEARDRLPAMPIAIAAIEIGRSITDYVFNWKFYFPDDRTIVSVE